ncbi:MAG: hypothetical protein LUH23_03000 [Oscillospiraceae bacterium]|nr:hypothetical protein [Oscillospiraceae bacterium]
MSQVNLNNPLEIQIVGMNALKEALGPIGTVRFLRQCNPGTSDYTSERQAEPDVDPDEAIARIHEFKQKKQQGML